MRHSAISLMLASAILLAGHPAAAQDRQPSRQELQEALDRLDQSLPDLGLTAETAQQEFDTDKPVVGFGFQIRDGDVHIARVLDGSAAQSAGLRVGMIIEKINGARLAGFTLEEIAKLIAAIDGELTFAIRDTGDVKLHKAPIEQQGS